VKLPGWAIALSVCAFFGALITWVVRVPNAKLVVPPFEAPHGVKKLAHPGGAPEDEPALEDLPTMPVGTVELPEQLDRRQLEAGMEKVRQHVEKCRGLEPFSGTLTVRLTIAQSGGVKSVVVVPPKGEPPRHDSPLADCVVKEVKRANFPRFRGSLIPTIELTYPFLFKDGNG